MGCHAAVRAKDVTIKARREEQRGSSAGHSIGYFVALTLRCRVVMIRFFLVLPAKYDNPSFLHPLAKEFQNVGCPAAAKHERRHQ
mgnify:CR=1 FL=1